MKLLNGRIQICGQMTISMVKEKVITGRFIIEENQEKVSQVICAFSKISFDILGGYIETLRHSLHEIHSTEKRTIMTVGLSFFELGRRLPNDRHQATGLLFDGSN